MSQSDYVTAPGTVIWAFHMTALTQVWFDC